MKKNSLIKASKFLLLCSFVALVFVGCSDDDSDSSTSSGTSERGDWDRRSPFDGDDRFGAVSFTIEGKGYVVGGFNNDDYFNETWEYDAEQDFWREVAKFPGEARVSAVGFSVGNFGYFGTGFNGEDDLNDFAKNSLYNY